MIEKIKEQNVWDILKNDNKPVVLYGMGLGAEKIMDTLAQYGIEVSDLFASDEFMRGHSFRATRYINTAKFAKNTMILMLCFALRVTLTA